MLRVVRGNDGRVALPGGARVWSDPNVWIGLYDYYESCAAEFGNEFEDDSYDDSYDDDDVGGPSLANPPGIEPATGRALRAANDRSCTPAALAGRMASVGLPPHAVAALLASACAKRSKKRSKKRSTKGGTNESRRTPLEKGADDVGKGRVGKSGATKTLGKTLEDADAAAGLPRRVAPIPASSADRVGRSVGRVWEVSSSLPPASRGIEPSTLGTPSDAPAHAVNPRGKTGAGIGVSHDAWIERMRRASRWVGTRGESAPHQSAPHQSAPHQSAPHPRGSQPHPGERGSDAENEAPWWARAEATAGLGGASPFPDVFAMSEFNGASKKKRTFTVRLNSRDVTVENGRIEEEEDEGDGDTPRRDGAILVDEGLDEYLSGLDLDGEEDFEFDDPRDEDEFLRFDRLRPLRRRGDWCDLPADVLAASPWSDRRERSARTSGGSDFVQPSNSTSRRNSIRLDGPDSRWGANTSSHHAITAVAVGAGGIAAVGSCHGAFAAWNPRTGVVVRARPGGWGEAVSVRLFFIYFRMGNSPDDMFFLSTAYRSRARLEPIGTTTRRWVSPRWGSRLEAVRGWAATVGIDPATSRLAGRGAAASPRGTLKRARASARRRGRTRAPSPSSNPPRHPPRQRPRHHPRHKSLLPPTLGLAGNFQTGQTPIIIRRSAPSSATPRWR